MNYISVNNDIVDCFALVKFAEVKSSKNGSYYMDLVFSDNDGEIPAKLWNYDADRYSFIKVGEIVKIRGTVEIYNEKEQFKILQIREICDDDEDKFSLDEVVPSAPYKGEDMYNYLMGLVDGFKDEDLKTIVKSIYEDNKDKLIYFPAAKSMHHAIRGGLLLHTSSIVKMCQAVCAVYPFINRELLISGAILHDIAKITEYDTATTGIVSDFSKEGELIGHLVKGAMLIDETAEKTGVDKDKAMLLEHMLLSHHGTPEYGAAVRPKFIEAEILSQLDLLDARIYTISDATKDVNLGEFTKKVFGLDNRRFYKENDNEYNVDLL